MLGADESLRQERRVRQLGARLPVPVPERIRRPADGASGLRTGELTFPSAARNEEDAQLSKFASHFLAQRHDPRFFFLF